MVDNQLEVGVTLPLSDRTESEFNWHYQIPE